MDALSKLPDAMDELLDGFMTHAIVGDTTVGLTQYIFWMFVAIALLFVVMFVFKKKQAQSLVPQGFFVNGMEYLVEFTRDDMCKSILGDTWKKHFPFIAALFFFILFNNIVGIIPVVTPAPARLASLLPLPSSRSSTSSPWASSAWASLDTSRALPQGTSPSHGHHGLGHRALLDVPSPHHPGRPTLLQHVCRSRGHGYLRHPGIALLRAAAAELLGGGARRAAVSVFWVLILIVIYLVEILVAVIQAYVFTLLSAVYIQLVEEDE